MFEGRFRIVHGPFTQNDFNELREGLWRNKRDIGAYSLTRDRNYPYADVNVPTGKMDLSPVGRKIVTGISSILIGLVSYFGYINLVRW